MSVLIQLIPFSDEMKSKQFAAWLGGELPAHARYGHNPTIEQIAEAFSHAKLDGFTLMKESSNKSWVAVLSDASGEKLHIAAKQRGQDKENVLFTVTGDRDLLESLVAHLPAACGSYLISTDGERPIIVTAGGA